MVINIAEAKAKFSSLLAAVGMGKEEVVISKRNKPVAVILSYDAFMKMKERLERPIALQALSSTPSGVDKYAGIVSEEEIDYGHKESREAYLCEKYL